LKIFRIFPVQLLEDFDIAEVLRLYIVALLVYNVALYLPAGRNGQKGEKKISPQRRCLRRQIGSIEKIKGNSRKILI
jgi:hypothetical protein